MKTIVTIGLWILPTTWAILSGCHSWTESGPLSYSEDDIWHTTYSVLSRRYDVIHSSREKRTMETDWKFSMDMWYLKSYRNKVYVEIVDYAPGPDDEIPEDTGKTGGEKIPPGPEKYILKIQVLQEQNRNADNPASVQEASWMPVGNNAEEEQNLLNFILAKLTLRHATDLR